MAVTNVGKKDFAWTLASMFIKVGAGVLLYPFVLTALSAQEVGIWTIFNSISILTLLFDFGFNASFTRNISYIFSGVSELKAKGYEQSVSAVVDYSLLNSTIKAMRVFYSRIALALFFICITLGTYYVYCLLDDFNGSRVEVYCAWGVVCTVNCYLLYTKYYEALLMGKGMVKRSSQINVIGNSVYVVAAVIFLLSGYGLFAVVASQGLSVIVIRVLSYKSFYTNDIKAVLTNSSDMRYREVLKSIAPNAVKLGLTTLGGFVINRSSTFIGSLFVPLEQMASYGISLQIILIVAQVSTSITRVYMPKICQWRVERNNRAIRRIYWLSSAFLLCVFAVSTVAIVLCGNWALSVIRSETVLLPTAMLVVLAIQCYLDTNHANAADFLTSKNEVPFFKASLLSAAGVVVVLYIFETQLNMGLWGMILAPAIVQALYQNWRWPLMVIKDLKQMR